MADVITSRGALKATRHRPTTRDRYQATNDASSVSDKRWVSRGRTCQLRDHLPPISPPLANHLSSRMTETRYLQVMRTRLVAHSRVRPSHSIIAAEIRPRPHVIGSWGVAILERTYPKHRDAPASGIATTLFDVKSKATDIGTVFDNRSQNHQNDSVAPKGSHLWVRCRIQLAATSLTFA
jgi:hypothetical protein